MAATHPERPMPAAAYVHVPFCAHRCGYCDFTLISGRDDLIGDFLTCLQRELDAAHIAERPRLNTLFFGGGTPTHLSPAELNRLLKIMTGQFELTANTEFSVEANPLDLTEDRLDVLQEGGVNRISLGVQSFDPQTLQRLERNHSPSQIEEVMQRLRGRFENISLDLIFGVPQQTLNEWRETLQRAIDIGPAHISAYGLTFEQGTAFWTRRERGQLQQVDEELERDQYALAMDLLPAAGFQQYEISNYSRPGFECRHNNVYWNGDEYWAFGPGAARYVNGRRETNIRSVLAWLSRIERGMSAVSDAEELDPRHRANELVYLGLRRVAGIRRASFRERSGFDLDDLYGPIVQAQVQRGLLEDDGESIRLTRAGRFLADRIVTEFL